MLSHGGPSHRSGWKILVMLLGLALLSGCVVVPRGGYYIHPCWHCGWRR